MATTRLDSAPRPARFGPPAWLALLTVLGLAPFAGRAFHIDDPLFVWTARHIVTHPLDPYGYPVVWYLREMMMSDVTKNPPLASYFAAVAGAPSGWSEVALHLLFMLPAVAVVLATARLAARWCRAPWLAAAATALAPGFLVSACGVMCDTLMLAFWMWAAALWIEGLESRRPARLAIAGFLIGAAALTKYFGLFLVPIVALYSLARERRLGRWCAYLAIPLLIMAAYELWTRALYGRGLMLDASRYAREFRAAPSPATVLVALAFMGGCALPALTLAGSFWSRRAVLIGLALGAAAGLAIAMGWFPLASRLPHGREAWIGAQLAVLVASGLSVVGLAVAEARRWKSAEALMLAAWVIATVVFAGFLNWTINARSLLPLVPAVGILMARRWDARHASGSPRAWSVIVPLALSGAVSLGLAWADARLADAQRDGAARVIERTRGLAGRVWFQGHWGFQYYMQELGARPLDVSKAAVRPGDVVVVPENNTNTFEIDPALVGSRDTIEVPLDVGVATMQRELGAGYYASVWGPLPFAFGRVPPARFHVVRMISPR